MTRSYEEVIGAARGHLLGWCSYTDSAYRTAKHIRLLADSLMWVEATPGARLVITLPPRHSKSETASIKFPSWYLGRNPDHRIILASYSAALASTFSRRVRNDFHQFANEIFGLSVSSDSKAKDIWDIKGYKGGVVAAGVEGSLTGKGADCLIIDDPHKDASEANSPLIRGKVWDWYRSVARTRVHPGGKICLIQTRWHASDLAGKILSEDDGNWRVLNLPALADDDDILGRQPGEALWPERYGVEDLKAIRKDIGSYAFEALYQQRPSPPEGALVKKQYLRYYTDLPDKFDKMIQTWDLAVEATDTSSFVVGQIWGRIGPKRYLLDQFRNRVDIIGSMAAIKNMRKKWPQARTTYVEKKANGPAVIRMLKDELDSILAFDPKSRSKEQRLNACLPLLEAGDIILPDPSIAPWINDFVHELVTFPYGQNDDQVDCFSMAQDRFSLGSPASQYDLRLHVGDRPPLLMGTGDYD